MADAIKKSQAEAEERMMNEKSARERTTRDRPQGRRDERDRRLDSTTIYLLNVKEGYSPHQGGGGVAKQGALVVTGY